MTPEELLNLLRKHHNKSKIKFYKFVTGRIYIVHVMSMYILTVTITTLYLCVYLVCMCSCVCVCACMSSLFPSLRFSQDIQSYPTHEWSMAGSTPHRLLMWKTGQSVVSDVPH